MKHEAEKKNISLKSKFGSLFRDSCSMFQKSESARGFTLLEVLVSLSIMILIGAVVLANNSKFNSEVQLTNLAYEVALTVREAQVFGTSVREAEAGSGDFNAGYGVHVNMGNPNSYIFYVDRNGNSAYDGGTELRQSYTIQRGHFVKRICVEVGGSENCSDTGTVSSLDIMFNRPRPNADISSNVGGGPFDSARIDVAAPSGSERSVLVESSGQVSIQE